MVNQGGVVIWDIPFERNGTMKPAFIKSLKTFNALVRTPPSAYEEWQKRTGGRMIPEGNLACRRQAVMAAPLTSGSMNCRPGTLALNP